MSARRGALGLLIALGLGLGLQAHEAAAQSAMSPPPTMRADLTVIRSPVGKQFLSLGVEAGGWLGTGTLRALEDDGTLGATLAEPTTFALTLVPLQIGLTHVVARRVVFEARLQLGGALFLDDTLVSRRLTGENGEPSLGLLLGAELVGRYVADNGFTLGFGANFSRVGLPDETGIFLRVAPRIGYWSWDKDFTGYWMAELAYQFPFINGLEPEFDGARELPIDSTWHMLALYLGFSI